MVSTDNLAGHFLAQGSLPMASLVGRQRFREGTGASASRVTCWVPRCAGGELPEDAAAPKVPHGLMLQGIGPARKPGLHPTSHLQGLEEVEVPFAGPMCPFSHSQGAPSWRWKGGVPRLLGTLSITSHLPHECRKPN